MPRIAISVDMLDTGIDVREIVNSSLPSRCTPTLSSADDRARHPSVGSQQAQALCTEKEVFLVLDCWDNFEYFKLQPKARTKGQLPLPVRLVGLRLDKIEKANASVHIAIAEARNRQITPTSQRYPRSRDHQGSRSTLARWTKKNSGLTHAAETEFLRVEIKPLFPPYRSRLQGHAFRARPARVFGGRAE